MPLTLIFIFLVFPTQPHNRSIKVVADLWKMYVLVGNFRIQSKPSVSHSWIPTASLYPARGLTIKVRPSTVLPGFASTLEKVKSQSLRL